MTTEMLMTRSEVARLLRKPESWLRYAERRQVIPYLKIGQHIRYRREDVDAWLRGQRVARADEKQSEIGAESPETPGRG